MGTFVGILIVALIMAVVLRGQVGVLTARRYPREPDHPRAPVRDEVDPNDSEI